MHDEAHLLNAGGQHFLNEDAEGGLRHAVAIHEGLEGQGSLVTTGHGNDSFFNIHGVLWLVSYQAIGDWHWTDATSIQHEDL
jgi:hypothetical protein